MSAQLLEHVQCPLQVLAPEQTDVATEGCPMTNGGDCPTDQKTIDKCPEC